MDMEEAKKESKDFSESRQHQCSSTTKTTSRQPKKTSLGLMQKILSTNKALKAKQRTKKKTSKICFVEVKRCSKTGERIYKPKRQRLNTENKKSNNKIPEPSNEVSFQDEFMEEQLDGTDSGNDANDIEDNVEPMTNQINSWFETLKKFVKSKKKKKSWHDRSRAYQEDWDKMRLHLWKVMQAREVPNDLCAVCGDRQSDVRCLDCYQSYCYLCDDVYHLSNPFHDRLWSGRPLDVLECLNEKKEIVSTVRYPPLKCPCSVCGSENVTKVPNEEYCIVITLKGRFDLNKFHLKCNECPQMTDPFTHGVLLRSGFWPGNPKSLNYLFKEEVFQLWDNFRKFMPGSSERAFLKSLNAISDDHSRIAITNPNYFSMSFREWCLWMDQKDLIQSKDWMECPACHPNPHSCHVDGNCKLYRFKRGVRQRESFYNGRFVIPNENVSKFVEKLYKDKTKKDNNDSICGGTWSAAQNVSRKMAKLDETGLEVATCRHVLAQKAINMFRGEIFGYPYFLIKEFMIPRGTNFCFADVMCKLWPFMTRDDPSIKTLISPALSIMHAKGHSHDCQVIWSGEWLKGTGRSTGEETEQLFSYLSRFGNSTKYQLPEKREETLTEAVLHWNKVKVKKIVPDLAKRYRKNEEHLSSIGDLSLEYSEDTIMSWKNEIQNEARGLRKRIVRQPTKEEKLLLLVEKLHLPPDFHVVVSKMSFPKTIDFGKVYRLLEFDKKEQINELEQIAKEVKVKDLKNAHTSLSQMIFLPLIEKAIEKSKIDKIILNAKVGQKDTSKKRRTVRTKLAALKKSEAELFNDYLLLIGKPEDKSMQVQLEHGVLPWLDDSSCSEAVKRRTLVEKYLKRNRYLEEKGIIVHEMRNTIDFMQNKIKRMMQESKEIDITTVADEDEGTSDQSILMMKSKQGLKALKEQGVNYYRIEFENAIKEFLPFVDPNHEHEFEIKNLDEDDGLSYEKDIGFDESEEEEEEELVISDLEENDETFDTVVSNESLS